MTQGLLGSLFCLTLREACTSTDVVSVVTHTRVSTSDPAFDHPTKPIGPFYSPGTARDLAAEKGWEFIEDSGRGYRRVVPSPAPVEILETRAITRLVEDGYVVVAAGGGGIPVTASLEGVDAVIDKDLAAALLGGAIGARSLVLVTGVDAVMLDYGTPRQRVLGTVTAQEMRQYLAAGQFPEGSMGPKVRAALEFLDGGGSCAVITSAGLVSAALHGHGGTRIVRGAAGRGAA
jgi:carbamate kinase